MKPVQLLFLFILGIITQVNAQVTLTSEIMPAAISSGAMETDPFVSPEGDALVFLRKSTYMVSKRVNGTWQKPLSLDIPNFKEKMKVTGFDGEFMYIDDRNLSGDKKKTHNRFYRCKLQINGMNMMMNMMVPLNMKINNLDFGYPYRVVGSVVMDGKQKLIESTINNGQWDGFQPLPKHITLSSGNKPHVMALGKNAIIYSPDRNSDKLMFTYRSNNQWSYPERLYIPNLGQVNKVMSYAPKTGHLYYHHSGDIYRVKLPDNLASKIEVNPPPKVEVTQVVTRSVAPATAVEPEKEENEMISDRYHALIIGINDYLNDNQDLVDLDQPTIDGERLANILKENYSFDPENVITMKDPSRADIIFAFEELAGKLNEHDNLLIFYAGHGVFDEKLQVGYWLPVDAHSNRKSNWISNSTVRDYISGIPTKHTLLITDACFSGSIFKSRAVTNTLDAYAFSKVYKLPSRKAMTSGTLKTVPDQSKFMQYLMKRLENNDRQFLPSKQLFYEIEAAVLNNTDNVPQYGTIHNAGDEGGDFIFIKKQ